MKKVKDPMEKFLENLEKLRKKHEAEANANFEKIMRRHFAEDKRRQEMEARPTEARIRDLETEVARLKKEMRNRK